MPKAAAYYARYKIKCFMLWAQTYLCTYYLPVAFCFIKHAAYFLTFS